MRRTAAHSAAHILCAAGLLTLPPVTPAKADPEPTTAQGFPVLPLPPAIKGLIGLPQTYTKGRSTYLALITSEAERRGLPAAVADAVAKVESGFDPNAVGGVGEVGLMQVRPETAAMLGYTGDVMGLFEPEVNVRFGVAYLARAWELAKGDICRTLMKYRAGWGEERMTPLSVEYCRRAQGHLAAIGSPLAQGALPTSAEPATPFGEQSATNRSGTLPELASRAAPLPNGPLRSEPVRIGARASARNDEALQSKPQAARLQPAAIRSTVAATRIAPPPVPPDRLRVASVEAVKLPDTRAQALVRAREQARARTYKRRRIWVEHDRRMQAITAKLKAPQLKIMSGL